MNEIIIDDKKYVSSKQAAEITGYAKDYVGQLCREGRVPARLIGRSWYVLESALQDHRFGRPEVPPTPVATEKQAVEEPGVSKTWEHPRYEAESLPHFPFINKLAVEKKAPESAPEPQTQESEDGIETMHEAWKQWFSGSKGVPQSEETKETDQEPLLVETQEVRIPIHTRVEEEIRPHETILPKQIFAAPAAVSPDTELSSKIERRPSTQKKYSVVSRVSAAVLTVLVLLDLGTAFINSPYGEAYAIKSPILGYFSGIRVLNN